MQFHKWEVCIGTYVCATTYLSRDSPLPLTVSFANCLSVFAQSVKQPSEFPCSTDFSIIIHALLLIITPFNKSTRRERKKIYFYLNKIDYFHLLIFQTFFFENKREETNHPEKRIEPIQLEISSVEKEKKRRRRI